MNHDNVKLILASQSPRRRQLLEQAGFQFDVLAPPDHVERSASAEATPAERVVESALLKARFVARRVDEGIILAADTVAQCGDQVLGKPESREDAARMLRLMSGQQHQVLTGVCLWHRPSNLHQTYLESTSLVMDKLSEPRMQRFLDSNGWRGKAGGFGYQDGLDWVHVQSGLESNVVGLPVENLNPWITRLLGSIP